MKEKEKRKEKIEKRECREKFVTKKLINFFIVKDKIKFSTRLNFFAILFSKDFIITCLEEKNVKNVIFFF